jgi:hypothetical protein
VQRWPVCCACWLLLLLGCLLLEVRQHEEGLRQAAGAAGVCCCTACQHAPDMRLQHAVQLLHSLRRSEAALPGMQLQVQRRPLQQGVLRTGGLPRLLRRQPLQQLQGELRVARCMRCLGGLQAQRRCRRLLRRWICCGGDAEQLAEVVREGRCAGLHPQVPVEVGAVQLGRLAAAGPGLQQAAASVRQPVGCRWCAGGQELRHALLGAVQALQQLLELGALTNYPRRPCKLVMEPLDGDHVRQQPAVVRQVQLRSRARCLLQLFPSRLQRLQGGCMLLLGDRSGLVHALAVKGLQGCLDGSRHGAARRLLAARRAREVLGRPRRRAGEELAHLLLRRVPPLPAGL